MRAGDHLSGRYRLDARLGHGGMGEVWKGYDVELGRAVALKVLLEFDAPDELLQRFRREASIGARLQHPGITVVHDAGRHDNRMFIVMELLEGADLADVLARSPAVLRYPKPSASRFRPPRRWPPRMPGRWCTAISSLATSSCRPMAG